MNSIMRVSGAEALSNVASAFVGQVEAQVMIRPYLAGMTKSELLASMSGSLACIAGGILVVYVNMGAQAGMDLAPKLITASLMAAPGALVIAKIVFPETEESQTMGNVKLEVKSNYINVIDAISHGAAEGFKIALNVIAMLIGFIAVIACIDWAHRHHRPLVQSGLQPHAQLDLRQALLSDGLGHGRARARTSTTSPPCSDKNSPSTSSSPSRASPTRPCPSSPKKAC